MVVNIKHALLVLCCCEHQHEFLEPVVLLCVVLMLCEFLEPVDVVV